MQRRATILVAAALVSIAAFVLWEDSSPLTSRNGPTDARGGAESETRLVGESGSVGPIASSRFVERKVAKAPTSLPSAASRAAPLWIPPPAFGDKTIDEVARRFENVPEEAGGWLRASVDPWAVGWEQLYSFAPEHFDSAVEEYVAAFYEHLVSERREAPERSDPAVVEWPYFSEWLKSSIMSYSLTRRREMYALAAEKSAAPLDSKFGDPKELRPAIGSSVNELRDAIRTGIEAFLRYK